MTDVERLILHNQYTILCKLDPKNKRAYYPCLEVLSDADMWNDHDLPRVVMDQRKPCRVLKLKPVSDPQQA